MSARSRRVLVIAGNRGEYERYMRAIGVSPNDPGYAYVDRLEQVRGCRGARLALVGNYELSPLWPHMDVVRALIQE